MEPNQKLSSKLGIPIKEKENPFLNLGFSQRFILKSTLINAYSNGGSMWESNPPERLLTPQTGFEDQRAHQHPSTPMYAVSVGTTTL